MYSTIIIAILFTLFITVYILGGSKYHEPIFILGNDVTFNFGVGAIIVNFMNLYICVIGTFAAFQRWDRFGISHDKPWLSFVLSSVMVALPFLGFFISMYFTVVLLLFLSYSQFFSKTNKEKKRFKLLKSNGFYTVAALFLFSGVLCLLNFYPYDSALLSEQQQAMEVQ